MACFSPLICSSKSEYDISFCDKGLRAEISVLYCPIVLATCRNAGAKAIVGIFQLQQNEIASIVFGIHIQLNSLA